MGYRSFGFFYVSELAPKYHVCDQYNVGKMAIRVYQALSEIGFLLKPLGNFSPMQSGSGFPLP